MKTLSSLFVGANLVAQFLIVIFRDNPRDSYNYVTVSNQIHFFVIWSLIIFIVGLIISFFQNFEGDAEKKINEFTQAKSTEIEESRNELDREKTSLEPFIMIGAPVYFIYGLSLALLFFLFPFASVYVEDLIRSKVILILFSLLLVDGLVIGFMNYSRTRYIHKAIEKVLLENK